MLTSPRGQTGFSYMMYKAGEEHSAFCGLSQRLPTQMSVLVGRGGMKCSLVVQSLFAVHEQGWDGGSGGHCPPPEGFPSKQGRALRPAQRGRGRRTRLLLMP